ncbi:hypothetical protein CA54_40680 [Symmachiella macrocystis]|uniref:Uncharacterized protein n=1 Tax=Symmachiella macrocystis TaxID=2527985 RepID=A0A5C6BBJ7_9PLAN|nr:hypothetical protein CA54_40680 [Symmachiella macrocystis]
MLFFRVELIMWLTLNQVGVIPLPDWRNKQITVLALLSVAGQSEYVVKDQCCWRAIFRSWEFRWSGRQMVH